MADQRLNCRFVTVSDPVVRYQDGLDLQHAAQAARISGYIDDTVYLLEHTPTVTIGRSSKGPENLKSSTDDLTRRGIETVEVDRGGDITYHAPGQLVGYPVLDLNLLGRDLHLYLRNLERALIRTLESYHLSAYVVPGRTGVWIDDRKIAAIGIKVTRWVTMHGFALNITADLAPMRGDMIPCGIADKGVTSLAELGVLTSRAECEARFIEGFCDIFNVAAIRQTASVAVERDRISGLSVAGVEH